MASGRGGVRLALAGDVMTGRGIDQVLATPGDPTLHERYVSDAGDYVSLAEQASGPIPRRADATWVWGELLDDLAAADVRVVNLETAVTHRGHPWPGKGIHYRMHPANVSCLAAADLDVATLANNHALDWSQAGLAQSLAVLADAGITTVGAGRDRDEAWTPAVVATTRPRVVVVGIGATSSGIPPDWAATGDRAGLAVVDLGDRADTARVVAVVAEAIETVAAAGDVVVASIHWGRNWGWRIPRSHRRFAHALLDDAGVTVVHGHSSHHVLGIEVDDGRPILYGCGDLVTDYEGIKGHERYRGDLGGLYLLDVDESGRVRGLEIVPSRLRRFRLEHAGQADREWLTATLQRESARFGVDVVDRAGRLAVRW